MTAASATSGWAIRRFSNSREEIHSPPDLIRSFVRSTRRMYPSGLTAPTSPVRNQPSAVKDALLPARRGSTSGRPTAQVDLDLAGGLPSDGNTSPVSGLQSALPPVARRAPAVARTLPGPPPTPPRCATLTADPGRLAGDRADSGHSPGLQERCPPGRPRTAPWAPQTCRPRWPATDVPGPPAGDGHFIQMVGTPPASVTPSSTISLVTAGGERSDPGNTRSDPAATAAWHIPQALAWNMGTTGRITSASADRAGCRRGKLSMKVQDY